MRVLVDEMPATPADCNYSYRYGDQSGGEEYICDESGSECPGVDKCPFYARFPDNWK